jgi:hypothetical protein
MGWTPDTTIHEMDTAIRDRGFSGITLFCDRSGWRANLKREGSQFVCGLTRPTLWGAIAQVFGDESPQDRDLMELL